LGVTAALLGDKWNLGFLAETERQVEGHLGGHLQRIPAQDRKTRVLLEQMKKDEARHARSAFEHGAAPLPVAAKCAMAVGSRVMTRSTYWI
jgi:ubiquinone biosynthesis monooxygenase Coq7